MKISVIIPCYNAYKMMGRCLEALEKQTFREFEVCIVDDCSTDESYEALLEYSRMSLLEIRIFKTEYNVGPGEARNIAIKNARGEFLAFCDSDDWYEACFLEKMYNKIITEEADIVMCNYRKVFDNGKREEVEYTRKFETLQKKYMAFSKSSFWLLMVRRTLFRNLEIPKLKNGEDIAVVPVLLNRANKITHLLDVLYNYYIRNDSLSTKPNEKICSSLLTAFEFIEENIEKNKHEKSCEFIGIRIVLYGGILNALKTKSERKAILEIINSFESRYPKWLCNEYIKEMGTFQKIFLYCIKNRWLILAKLMAKFHYLYTRQ
ncbi:MAG: glycosyltransferase [Clostridiales bacterium]|nr:glycosyltransferase [Clostridiales bacterium]